MLCHLEINRGKIQDVIAHLNQRIWVHVCLMYVASHSGKCEMSNNFSGLRILLQHGLQITNAPQKTGGYGEETRWLQAYMSLQAVQCNLDVFW